jgi:hypothetical protein
MCLVTVLVRQLALQLRCYLGVLLMLNLTACLRAGMLLAGCAGICVWLLHLCRILCHTTVCLVHLPVCFSYDFAICHPALAVLTTNSFVLRINTSSGIKLQKGMCGRVP